MSWKDHDYTRGDPQGASYPWIQWANDGGALEPRSKAGGFAMPVEQMERLERSIPGEVRNLHHRGGDATDVVFTAELEAAVLDTRFVWVKDGQALPDYEDGARGKLQASERASNCIWNTELL